MRVPKNSLEWMAQNEEVYEKPMLGRGEVDPVNELRHLAKASTAWLWSQAALNIASLAGYAVLAWLIVRLFGSLKTFVGV